MAIEKANKHSNQFGSPEDMEENLKEKNFIEVKKPKMGDEESEGDDAVELVNRLHIAYPILIFPWGENSGDNYFAANNDDELKAGVQNILKKTGYERRVHLISRAPQEYASGEYPSEATLK